MELIRSLVPLGLLHVQEVLDQEVRALAGERYARKDASVGGRRHGSNPGTVGLAGQRVPMRVPRIRGVAGCEIPLCSYEALHRDGEVNDLLLKRVLYGISCRNYEAAAAAIPGAIGLSGSTVSRAFIQASAAKLRELQERNLAGEDVVAVVLDGKTFAAATMVIALGITIAGEKRFLGFVETDTENEKVLTPFLRSLVERGLDLSQGVLVILDGGKGLRSAVRKAFRHRALVQRCQWHKRENVVSYLAKREQVVWRQRLQRAYTRPDYAEALGALKAPWRVGRSEPVGRRQPGGRPGRDLDAASTRAVRRAGPVAEDDELSGVRQCARRGTLCEGRPLAELEPTPPLAGDRAPGHRTALAEGDGLPPPAHAPCRVTARTEDRHDDVEEERRVSHQEPWRVSTTNGLDSVAVALTEENPQASWPTTSISRLALFPAALRITRLSFLKGHWLFSCCSEAVKPVSVISVGLPVNCLERHKQHRARRTVAASLRVPIPWGCRLVGRERRGGCIRSSRQIHRREESRPPREDSVRKQRVGEGCEPSRAS